MSMKFKSFPVDKSDELNKFIEAHPPLASKENNDNGISLHNGYFIVRYEDGMFNDKSFAISLADQSLHLYRSNIVIKDIESQATIKEMRKLFKGIDIEDLKKKDTKFFRDYFTAKGLSNEHANKWADAVLKQLRDLTLAEYEKANYQETNIPCMEAVKESYK